MFVEITRGRSFAGLARYCLHDEGKRPTNDRVDFAVVRNLSTEDPNVAWRLMTAKHYQQERLKEEAGVGRGGSKNGQAVGHLLLSWKPEEAQAEQLDRNKMISAAEGAMRAIGASRREAIIVSHNDTEHPHLHVILCLIQDDGRLKSNWKEREKLSKWALKRERKLHGEAIVKKREENWEARERGETPAREKKKARHLYELEKAAKRDAQLARFAEQHLLELATHERRKQAGRERRQAELKRLLKSHVDRTNRRQRENIERVAAAKSAVRKAHRPHWRQLLVEQEAARRRFKQNELTLRGQVANAFKSADWRAMARAARRSGGVRNAMGNAFRLAHDETARKQGLARKQEREKAALLAAQQRVEQQEKAKLGSRQRKLLRAARIAYLQVVKKVERRHQEELIVERRAQRQLTRERNQAMRASRARTWAERAANKLTLSRRAKKRKEKPALKISSKERAQPLDIAGGNESSKQPKKAGEVARQMDEAKVVIKKRKRRERKPRKERRSKGERKR